MDSLVLRVMLSSVVVLAALAGFGLAAEDATLDRHNVKTYKPVNGDPFQVTCPSTSKSAYWTNGRGFKSYGAVLAIPQITLNYTGYYSCYDHYHHLIKLKDTIFIDVQIREYKPLNGDPFNYTCASKSKQAYWTNGKGFTSQGSVLAVSKISMNYTGRYYCYEKCHDNELCGKRAQDAVIIDVQIREYKPLNGDPFNYTCASKSKNAYWTNGKGFTSQGSVLAVSKITMNYTGRYYCYEKCHDNELCGKRVQDAVIIDVQNGGRYNATEGQIFGLQCSSKSFWTYWTNKKDFYERGRSLSFFPAKRADAGWYYCYSKHNGPLVETVYIDVLYSAKILKVTRDNQPLNENDTFTMTVVVEGHPDPTTSFVEQDGGKIISKKSGPGEIKIKTNPVHCADGGMYKLMTQNSVGKDTKNEELLVYCAPSPRAGISKKLKPRLGETVPLIIENIGYPYPTYTWSFKGEVLYNDTGPNKNEYDIENMGVDDFGKYTLTMSNEFGESTIKYSVDADGPPDPVTSLDVTNVTEHGAVISFTSGYDYNAYQTFIVESFDGEQYEETEIFPDKARKHTPHEITHELNGLDLGTTYNITIMPNNSRGEGEMASTFVVFTTEAPYTKYEIREGESLHLECNGTDMKDVHWELSNGTVVSGNNTIDLENVTRDESGFYKCVGRSKNNLVHILQDYEVDVQYPGKILNISIEDNYFNVNETLVMEIEVEGHPTPTITFTKVRHGEIVFADKREGTLNITVDPIECTDLGIYELKVSNEIGIDTYEQPIFVYCPPVVDPQVVIKKKVYPRLGHTEALKVENYGYPYPTYKWKHGDNPIDTHKDSDYESRVDLDVTPEDFGNYFVDMANEYGQADFSFEVIAAGPPDPITDFRLDNNTFDSVTLSWTSGYNYGTPQTFVVMVTTVPKTPPIFKLFAADTRNITINDTSAHGLEPFTYVISGLEPETEYQFMVVSTNGNGTSALPAGEPVKTQTSDAPAPAAQTSDKAEKDAIIGGVIGAVCFCGIIAIVAVFLKKRHTRRTTYEQIEG